MAKLDNFTDAQLTSKKEKLQKTIKRIGNDNPQTVKDLKAGIKEIDDELAKRKKPTAEKPESKPKPKPKPKPTAEKPKPKPKDEKPKDEKPSGKRTGGRGVKMLSTKTVSVDGVEMKMDSQEFCDYLLAEFKERRSKAEARKSEKKKTKSVMAKVSDNIEKGISQAIKESVKNNKAKIEKNPREFFGKVKKLETATRTFLNSLKSVLGNEFDGKEVTSTIKGIQDLVNELKKKVEK